LESRSHGEEAGVKKGDAAKKSKKEAAIEEEEEEDSEDDEDDDDDEDEELDEEVSSKISRAIRVRSETCTLTAHHFLIESVLDIREIHHHHQNTPPTSDAHTHPVFIHIIHGQQPPITHNTKTRVHALECGVHSQEVGGICRVGGRPRPNVG
jgi:hypothetical protein